MTSSEQYTQVENIARVCHEANREWCYVNGDTSQVRWHLAPAWQKESAINGVHFHLENPGAGPEESHENWLKVKLAEGWVYGPVKDEGAKTHPCCVPFSQLPAEQQAKDRIFGAIVRAIVGAFDPEHFGYEHTHAAAGLPDEPKHTTMDTSVNTQEATEETEKPDTVVVAKAPFTVAKVDEEEGVDTGTGA